MRRHAEFRACVYTLSPPANDMIDPTAKLITELTAPNYHIRARAASTLGELQAIQSIPALLEALGDFDPADESSRVNMCASDALAAIGAPALEPLITALQEKRLSPHDGWRRYWVTEALGILGDPHAVEPLITALADSEKGVREGAAEALGRIQDTRALVPLKHLLDILVPSGDALYLTVAWAIMAIQERHADPKRPKRVYAPEFLRELLGIQAATESSQLDMI
jgi:HEAT repeat protein